VYLTLMMLVNAVLVYFYITALENEKGMIIWYISGTESSYMCATVQCLSLINSCWSWCVCWCSDRVGWICVIVFLQSLWALVNFACSFTFGTVLIICSDHLLTVMISLSALVYSLHSSEERKSLHSKLLS